MEPGPGRQFGQGRLERARQREAPLLTHDVGRLGVGMRKQRVEAVNLLSQQGGEVGHFVTVPAGGVSETPVDQIGQDETPEEPRSRFSGLRSECLAKAMCVRHPNLIDKCKLIAGLSSTPASDTSTVQ